MTRPLVEILCFEDCPKAPGAEELVRDVASALGVEADIRVRRVESAEEAGAARFLGSPTVRVDGHDVEPGADERRDYAFACRIYRTTSGLPDRDWIRAALRRS